MKVLASNANDKTVTYEARYWDGRYVLLKHLERWVDGRPLNTAPSVSYYSQLMAAFAKIGCRP